MKNSISVVVLTYNEEINLENCLSSVKDFAQEIFIIDSYSTDKTILVAEKFSAKVYQHTFETQAKQLNWALENLPIATEWVLRIDADERVTIELKKELIDKLPKLSSDVSGFYVKRKFYFMNKWIRFGGYYPTWLLRIWRNGKAISEEQILNEHMIILEGCSNYFKNDIVDHDQRGITHWIDKHNKYASRFAQEFLLYKMKPVLNDAIYIPSNLFGSQEQRKKWLKHNCYFKMPLFVRAFFYFIYRYFLGLGFLDGLRGFIFHFLHGFWYHFLVDVKIYERMLNENKKDNLQVN